MKNFLKKIKKFILKNKLLSVLLMMFILIFILIIIAVKVFIFPSYGSKYGNRLSGIDAVKLDKERFNTLKNSFDSSESFSLKDFRLSGKIVNFYVNVDGTIDISEVKKKAMEVINLFSEDEINYYDFQVFITCTSESDNYPIIGYKKASEGLHWVNEGEV